MNPAMKAQYGGGKGVNFNASPTGVKGSAMPIAQIMTVVAIRAGLAWLSKNGIFAVGRMGMMSVCVSRDSTNQPVLVILMPLYAYVGLKPPLREASRVACVSTIEGATAERRECRFPRKLVVRVSRADAAPTVWTFVSDPGRRFRRGHKRAQQACGIGLPLATNW